MQIDLQISTLDADATKYLNQLIPDVLNYPTSGKYRIIFHKAEITDHAPLYWHLYPGLDAEKQYCARCNLACEIANRNTKILVNTISHLTAFFGDIFC